MQSTLFDQLSFCLPCTPEVIPGPVAGSLSSDAQGHSNFEKLITGLAETAPFGLALFELVCCPDPPLPLTRPRTGAPPVPRPQFPPEPGQLVSRSALSGLLGHYCPLSGTCLGKLSISHRRLSHPRLQPSHLWILRICTSLGVQFSGGELTEVPVFSGLNP